MHHRFKPALVVLSVSVIAAFAQEPGDRFYQAIRNNDLSTLRTLLKTSEANLKDQKENTPLYCGARATWRKSGCWCRRAPM